MARLGYYRNGHTEYLCSGVLISRAYVLTAAHCVANRRDLYVLVRLDCMLDRLEIRFADGVSPLVVRIFVRLGDHGASGNDASDYYIEHIKVHENYSADTRGPTNDIAIIRVADLVFYNSKHLIMPDLVYFINSLIC